MDDDVTAAAAGLVEVEMVDVEDSAGRLRWSVYGLLVEPDT